MMKPKSSLAYEAVTSASASALYFSMRLVASARSGAAIDTRRGSRGKRNDRCSDGRGGCVCFTQVCGFLLWWFVVRSWELLGGVGVDAGGVRVWNLWGKKNNRKIFNADGSRAHR